MRSQTRIQCTALLFSDGRKNEKKKKKKNIEKRVVFGAVLTFRSEAFECIPHGLLIAKLNAFGFDKNHSPLLLPFSITETKN